MLDRETEKLVKQVRKELEALRARLGQKENRALLKAYDELRSTLD